jgi:repressor LexA
VFPVFADRLKELRKKCGLVQKDISRIFSVSMGAVGNWESGNRIPDTETLSRIADYFHVSVDYLLGREAPAETVPGLIAVKKKKIPVLGEIACGKPIFADEDRDVYVSVSDELVCDYALIAKGDSMLPRIHDGDLVFIREMPVVENGKIAAVLIEDEATLKRVFFYPEKQKLMLVSDNPAWEPFLYVGEELENVRILGLAVAAQTNLLKF